MTKDKKEHHGISREIKGSLQKEKADLHIRNKHRERYDFNMLTGSCPELAPFVKLNNYKDESIDFFDPEAVKMLNKALLKHYYNIDYWNIPNNYLCPAVPGRAEYIHHIADLLYSGNPEFLGRKKSVGSSIICLDVGTGANCVYPIIGKEEYGWSFIGTDIDPVSVESARKIVDMNPSLKGKVEIRLQNNPKDIYYGIIKKNERIDLSICNPPFHSSLAESQSGTMRKLRNLKHKKIIKPILNFGGQNNELWCEGGEEKFVDEMIRQSSIFSDSCIWFSTLISNQSNLNKTYKALKKVQAFEIVTIPMGHGNKASRIVAWTFLTKEQIKERLELK